MLRPATSLILALMMPALSLMACSKKESKGEKGGGAAELEPEVEDDPPDFGKQSTPSCLHLTTDDEEDGDESNQDDGEEDELSEVLPADACTKPKGSSDSRRELRITTTLDECAADGKSWSPIAGGSTSGCGAPLVDWCCTLDNIKARYPNMAPTAKSSLDRLESSELLLYHCSESDDRLEFHFAAQIGKEIEYEFVWIAKTKAKEPAGEDEVCSEVSMVDMGFPAESVEEDGTDEENPESQDEETPAAGTEESGVSNET